MLGPLRNYTASATVFYFGFNSVVFHLLATFTTLFSSYPMLLLREEIIR
uniref:Uncharacterized protein n=1 Tax=Arundo donax TaxID=35708 RepID=A0A0A9CCH3_ARUDO